MPDQITSGLPVAQTPSVTDTNLPGLNSNAPPTTPVPSPPVAAPVGSGASATASPPVSSTPGQSDVSFSDQLSWQDENGTHAVQVSDLVKAYDAYKKMGGGDPEEYALFKRASSGDMGAAQEWLKRVYPQAPATPAPTPAPQQQPGQQAQPQTQLPPGYEELVQFYNTQRAGMVKNQLGELLQDSKYNALARHPDAVNRILDELGKVYQQGIQLTPTIIGNVMQAMNEQEARYQDSILGPLKERMGELGVDDPFQFGGGPQTVPAKPDPVKEGWAKYSDWVSKSVNSMLASQRQGTV